MRSTTSTSRERRGRATTTLSAPAAGARDGISSCKAAKDAGDGVVLRLAVVVALSGGAHLWEMRDDNNWLDEND